MTGEQLAQFVRDAEAAGFVGAQAVEALDAQPVVIGVDMARCEETVARRATRTNPNLVENEDIDVRAPSHTAALFESPGSFRKIVDWACRIVRKRGYDAVAASGNSGLMLMGAVAARTGVRMIAVRKDDERPKGDQRMVNAALPEHRAIRYVFLDDLIASGETVQRVHRCIGGVFPLAEMAGVALYRSHYVEDIRSDLGRVVGDERAATMPVDLYDVWSRD